MRTVLRQIIFFVVSGVLAGSIIFPQAVLADTSSSAKGNILGAMQIFGANMGLSATDPRIIIARLVRTAMGFVGIVVLLMILSSGFSFMVAGGDEEKVKSAKRTFFNALIGLTIMLSAYSIVAFVLRSLSAATT